MALLSFICHHLLEKYSLEIPGQHLPKERKVADRTDSPERPFRCLDCICNIVFVTLYL